MKSINVTGTYLGRSFYVGSNSPDAWDGLLVYQAGAIVGYRIFGVTSYYFALRGTQVGESPLSNPPWLNIGQNTATLVNTDDIVGTAIPTTFYVGPPTAPDWQSNVEYAVGAIVAGEGANYYAIVDNIGTPPPTAVWLNIGANTAVRVSAVDIVGVYIPSVEMAGTLGTA